MRSKVGSAVVGLVLAVGGFGLLGYGILRAAGTGSEDCGDGCLRDPWLPGIPWWDYGDGVRPDPRLVGAERPAR